MLHKQVSPHTLGFARIWVFGLWLWKIWPDGFHHLSMLPVESFHPVGVLWFMPSAWHGFFLSMPFLLGLKGTLLLLLALVVLGVRPYQGLAVASCLLLTVYNSMVQSFGPVSHGDVPLLLAAFVLAAFPAADAFSMQRHPDRFASPETYQAAMVLITLIFTLTYSWIGIRRVAASAPGIFTDGTILRYMLLRSFEDGPYQTDVGLKVLRQPVLATSLEVGFVVTTIVEILAPLVLFNRTFRFIWLAIIIPFHFMTRSLMKIFFFWNLMMMPVFLFDLEWLFAPRRPRDQSHPVLFFDGECGLCNRFVKWLMAADCYDIFRFAPFEGETARAHGIKLVDKPDEWSLALADEAGTHHASAAALRAIGRLGAGWNAASLFLCVPCGLREMVYRWVARNRYRWFGKVQSCALLTPAQRARVLP
jgi:predicted DCC family thiol-disulfide oxidoreductase YuxK